MKLEKVSLSVGTLVANMEGNLLSPSKRACLLELAERPKKYLFDVTSG